MLTASQIGTAARRFQAAYAAVMAPLSRELDMAPSALDILLYLANNPGRDTARDICAYRHLKPGIVSLHVERLVTEGYLTRSPVPGNAASSARRRPGPSSAGGGSTRQTSPPG